MELNNIGRAGPMLGQGLNTEEASGLEVALLQRKLEENLSGKMYFWGKIFGSTQDYLVVHNINPYGLFPEKKYYFCTTSDYILRALPPLSKEYEEASKKVTSAFTGDPSFFAFNGEDPDEAPDDPDLPPVERFREVHRLSYTVKKIDHDCALVPRGALVVDASKRVIVNPYFEGLNFHTASDLRAYLHFRIPESLQGLALMKKSGIVKSGDFLDCVTKDLPQGVWSVAHDDSGTAAYIRNLYWEGYGFYNILGSPEYGGVYFGIGVPNYDIAFML